MVEAYEGARRPGSSAMLYRGVFTTVAFTRAAISLARAWERLATHALRLGISCEECDEKSVGLALQKLISVNQVTRDAPVPFYWAAAAGMSGKQASGPRKTDLLIMTGESRECLRREFRSRLPFALVLSRPHRDQEPELPGSRVVMGRSARTRFRRSRDAQRARRNCFGNDGDIFW